MTRPPNRSDSAEVVCLFEDRADCALGVKLLVLSALKHEPTWKFHAFLRNFKPADLEWLTSQPNVIVRSEGATRQGGWNVKPSLLKLLLQESGGPVIWCDSDIILASPVRTLIAAATPGAWIATEEYMWGKSTQGSECRVRGWGFNEGRRLKRTINSCFMRINMGHLPLLEAWDEALTSPIYQNAQAADWSARPVHLVSDQDVLTALLASDHFAEVELFLLKSGRDIAQCFQEDGYTVPDRLRNALLRRVPPLVHAQGGKPWKEGGRALYQQLSPYNRIALPYLKESSLPSNWISADAFVGKLMDGIVFGDANLRGVLPAAARTSRRFWKHRPQFLK